MAADESGNNPLQQLSELGQSPWIDYMRRKFVVGGELQAMVDNDGLKGMTSNPAIFEKAIGGSDDYDDDIRRLAPSARDAKDLYEQLAIKDIQDAADILRPVYERANRQDGCVSLEVAPGLAHDTEATLEEARRLWQTVDRPNLMVKIPATDAGVPAIQQAISEGINVNVTLLFSQDAYREVAEAYVSGLERRAEAGGELSHVASVASFFISRIDVAVDALLEEAGKKVDNDELREKINGLVGKIAIANAKVTYQAYQEIFSSERWQKLAAKGARPQRLLWASTGTKNPAYSDVLYVEELVGKDTVNTMPPATWDAFRDHGKVRDALNENVDEARQQLETLAELGVVLNDATTKLLVDAVRLFVEPFDKMLKTVEEAMHEKSQAA